VTNTIIGLTSGNEALDYVFARGAHAQRAESELLLLLDVNMPGINGIEVLRQIKTDPQKKKIPVIMLTTTDDPREVDQCYDLGCSVYVTKPVDPAAFIDAIKRLGMFISIVRAPRLAAGERDAW
jgi:CheY-like chemotaxis protein